MGKRVDQLHQGEGNTEQQTSGHSTPKTTESTRIGGGEQQTTSGTTETQKVNLGVSVLVCSHPSCNSEKIKSRGMCEKHYRAALRSEQKGDTPRRADDPIPVEINLPNRDTSDVTRAERPARQANQGKNLSRAKKQTGAQVKKKVEDILTSVLVGGTAFVASRTDEMWKMETQEAEAFASPIVDLLDQYGMLDSIGEKSPWVALAVAGISYAAPRIVMARMMKETNKPKGEITVVKQDRTSEGSHGTRDAGSDGGSTSVGTTSGLSAYLAQTQQPL